MYECKVCPPVPHATRHGLTLACTLDPALAEINADERKFKQVMLNPLSNAVKFTPEGGRITVTAQPVNDTVEVRVTDTGVGIAPEDCETVFEEFRQVGRHAEGKAEGTGLGLALTKKFIELHGGKIWLTSTPGKGSTFAFTLPRNPRGQTPERIAMANELILIIEDNEVNRVLVRDMLRRKARVFV